MNRKIVGIIFQFVLFIGDIFLIYLAFIIAYHARFYWPGVLGIFPVTKGMPAWTPYQQLFYLALFSYGLVFMFYRFYVQRTISVTDELILVVKGVFVGTLLVMAVTFIYHGYEYSRLVIGFGSIIAVTFIFLWHTVNKYGYQWFISLVIGLQNVLIIGRPEHIESIKRTIRRHKFIRPYFVLEDKDEKSLFDIIHKRKIGEVFITSTFFEPKRLISFGDNCEKAGVDFKVIPGILQLYQGEVLIDKSLSLPVFHIKPVSLHGFNFYYKRVFDVVISVIFLSIIFVPLLVTALLILADSPGPIFYYHKRMGHQSKPFDFLKFRTMVRDADKRLEQIKHLTEREGPVFKMKNDPRITRVGKFLRRFSIDELPQLINVLKGDMSLVGPRPQVLWEAAAYDDFAKRRLRILPGVTGLWQVSGRASLSYEEMIELDIYYMENWTLGLDLKILLKTIPAVFSKVGAY